MLDGEMLDFVGIHDFDEWYKYLYRWCEWHKFASITEKKYKEQRNLQPDGSTSKNIEIVWEASRSIDEYTQINIEVRIQCINQKDVEHDTYLWTMKDRVREKLTWENEKELFDHAVQHIQGMRN